MSQKFKTDDKTIARARTRTIAQTASFIMCIPAYYYLWKETSWTVLITIFVLFWAHNLDKHFMR